MDQTQKGLAIGSPEIIAELRKELNTVTISLETCSGTNTEITDLIAQAKDSIPKKNILPENDDRQDI